MPQRFQRPYPPEFRREAIRLVEATGRRYQDVARELGVSPESLRLWIKQAQTDRGQRDDGLTSGEREELRRLRRQVRELEAEREILKRAVVGSTGGRTRLAGADRSGRWCGGEATAAGVFDGGAARVVGAVAAG